MSVLGWRLLLAGLFSFLTVIVLGPATIRMLHRLKFGQSIREEGPASHLKKAGTPTMGGILILLGIVVGVLAGAGRQWGLPLLGLYYLGLRHALDDLLIRKKSLFLKARHVAGAGVTGLGLCGPRRGDGIHLVPFSDLGHSYGPTHHCLFDRPLYYGGRLNAVNLTDGLDTGGG